MSHAYGKVFRLSDGQLIGHFEYDGTSDYACSAIFDTQEQLDAAWRTNAAYRDCVCVDPGHVDVRLSADYGGGVEWHAKACLRCMAIVGPLDPREELPWVEPLHVSGHNSS